MHQNITLKFDSLIDFYSWPAPRECRRPLGGRLFAMWWSKRNEVMTLYLYVDEIIVPYKLVRRRPPRERISIFTPPE